MSLDCSPTRASVRAHQLQSFVDIHPAAEAEVPAAEQRVRQLPTQLLPIGSAADAGGCADGAEVAAAADSLSEATDAWAVVEHTLRSWPRDAPLLLLATCHVPLDTLPASLNRRFVSSSEQVHRAVRHRNAVWPWVCRPLLETGSTSSDHAC
jgi:hypothetical protein